MTIIQALLLLWYILNVFFCIYFEFGDPYRRPYLKILTIVLLCIFILTIFLCFTFIYQTPTLRK